ncbi:DNA polymerase III subunit delta' [Avibacterium sp. 21-586]|uniref:DNA polymerase III subunit delta' n=1 Tax=Avibacterium sp. 21-586 TaxID=2911534 RepID=UPI002247D021|nr:DNA polymerase III subunit delta' [Avibacterium sp. 21-586]MCW9710151.1 DNA polymerase III subunit delta' [Avibacterium sp. 21-586]
MLRYPWLQSYYDKIINAFEQGYGHHALLFKTEQGIGGDELVCGVAAWLMCQSPKGNQPCGTCHSCQLFNAGNHPDFYLLEPVENKDIGIDQVREVNEKVAQRSQQGGNKVVMIKQVDRLTESAANAILKTLEEPTEQTYFLLQADLSASLLATIYSRSQPWLIPNPAGAEALAWLETQLETQNVEKIEEIRTALEVSHGRPLSALDMLQQGLLEKRKQLLRQFWQFYMRRSPLELLPHFEKEILFQQLDWLSAFLRDALKMKLNVPEQWVQADFLQAIARFNQTQSAQGLLKASQIMQQVRSDLLQINGVNQEIILLDGLTRLITEVFEPEQNH